MHGNKLYRKLKRKMKMLVKTQKIAFGMKGNWRILLIAALVFYIAALAAIMPRLELLYARGSVSDTARAITYALLLAGIIVAVWRLLRGFRRLGNRGRSFALLLGAILFVSLMLLSPLFLEAGGIIAEDTRSIATPFVIAVTTLIVNVWCFSLLWLEAGDRDRKIDAHNRRAEEHNQQVEDRLEQIADYLGEIVELLQNKDAG